MRSIFRTKLDIANAIYKYNHNHYFIAIIKVGFFDENKYKTLKILINFKLRSELFLHKLKSAKKDSEFIPTNPIKSKWGIGSSTIVERRDFTRKGV